MAGQGDLFELPVGPETDAPLATRMRPKTFDDLVGQRQVVEVLRRSSWGVALNPNSRRTGEDG